jgi:hypothetical protein
MAFQDTASTADIDMSGLTTLSDQHDLTAQSRQMAALVREPRHAIPLSKGHAMMRPILSRRMPVVLVLGDGYAAFDAMDEMCDFLDIAIERVDGNTDLLPFLERYEPMAVIAAMDAEHQDGAYVLMTVARHDRGLPVLLMTDDDPVLAGAVDAIAELWGLTEVTQADHWLAPGDLAEFMCRAGMQGRCLALLPI